MLGNNPNNHKSGFTLLEIMVALSIMSLGLVIVIQTLASALMTVGISSRYNIAVLLAQQKLWDVQQGGYPAPGRDSGDFGERYPDYRWEIDVTPLQMEDSWNTGLETNFFEDSQDMLSRVEIAIIWPERGKDKQMKVTTCLANRELSNKK